MSWHIVTVAGLAALSRLTSIPPVGEQKSIRPERTDFCRPTTALIGVSCRPYLQSLLDAAVAERWRRPRVQPRWASAATQWRATESLATG
jgi:hypothetical protein